MFWFEDTHRVNYIPARDVNNHLIRPKHYQQRLEDAVVDIHFVIKHCFQPETAAGRAAHNDFSIDITDVYVLLEPNAEQGKVHAPSNKRTLPYDRSYPIPSPSPSPRKRLRVW